MHLPKFDANQLEMLNVKLKQVLVALMAIAILPLTSQGQATGPKMDIVFMLDISGSTGGILTSVRSKLWEIQNEIARLEPQPDFRFGLVCMGRPSFLKENDYIRIVSDLTSDVDPGAFEFFQIKEVTAPGRFYMGDGLETAINKMDWSDEPEAIKMIFLCGNGGISSGPGYLSGAREAKEKGIVIHSLYFETYFNAKEQATWKDLAETTGGRFERIGLKEPNIAFEKNYNSQMLQEASQMINTTYVYYGKEGLDRYEIQADLDEEAELQGEDQVEARTFFKANDRYQGSNWEWDLVDLHNTKKGYAGGASRKTLDENLQGMSDDELLMYVQEKSYERREYISITKLLSTQREQYMKKKREAMANFRSNKTFFGVVDFILVKTAEENGMKLVY
ncbi:MAG: hypothetical protein ACI9FU_000971 [Granulosicoccus sp.]